MDRRVAKALQGNSMVIYCVVKDAASIANASFLLAAFLLLVVGKNVHEAAEPFVGASAPFALAPFRDASFCPQVPSAHQGYKWAIFLVFDFACMPAHATLDVQTRTHLIAPRAQDFDLTLQDCLAGLAKAAGLGWYDRAAFDVAGCVGDIAAPIARSVGVYPLRMRFAGRKQVCDLPVGNRSAPSRHATRWS